MKYLSVSDIMHRYGIGRATVYKMVTDGVLPQPIKLGPRMVRWVEEELDEIDSARPVAKIGNDNLFGRDNS